MIDKARDIALQTLYKIDIEGAYSNIILDEMIRKNRNNLGEKDIGLISEIVYGVTTWKLTLDEIVKKYSKIKIKKISPWILNILRMSIYQIIFLDKIPKSAAVNEGVNLAKRYGHKSSSGFTNAILRKVSKDDYEEMFKIKEIEEKISKTNSIPKWIIEELKKDGLSYEKIEEICKCSNKKPKISIRTNKIKTDRESLKQKLKQEGIQVEEGILEDFLILSKAKGIEKIDEFRNGLFTVQDEAAGLVAIILNPNQGDNILDACSSPGGKTSYIAELIEDKGKIEAWDIHKHRTELVEKTAKRLGISSIQTKVQDATVYKEEYIGKFDKILLDVPCLGLGVLKRKPDIKWKRKQGDVKEISRIQSKILNICSKYLKTNGDLVYSTCSILKEENQKVIEDFLKKNTNFEIQKISLKKESFFNKYLQNEKFLQVYQNEETDGFFICKLRKKQ